MTQALAVCLPLLSWLTGAAPPPDLASPSAGAIVSGPQNASGSAGQPGCANDGQVSDYGPHHGYAWAWLEAPLVVTFPHPVTVSEVEVLLLDVDARRYSFRVEATSDGAVWQPVAEQRNATGWVTVHFAPVTCTALRLVFTGTSLATQSYHVVEVAVYSAPDPAPESPLRRAWLASRRAREEGGLPPLGVDEAWRSVLGDEAARARAARLPEGERRWTDTDRDGDPDLVLFRDKGALVVVLDDDDDMARQAPQPDEDSDCWVIDLTGDGRVERVLDYLDDDADGDADRAHHYYLHGGWLGPRPGLVLLWDYDDDNRMWQLDRYSYDQGRCQWGCDFGGNEGFSLFVWDRARREWAAEWECPFYFYDPDADHVPDTALRLEGHGRSMRALRYSVNADDDATPGQPYDYDCAVVGLGPVELPEKALVTTPLRTGSTGPYWPYETAREGVLQLPWRRALLVWDENDLNIDPGDPGRHERWEGIINAGYEDFPQVGGPHCGRLNKRYELDTDGSGKLRLYVSHTDGRLHLLGAEKGSYLADYNLDGRADRAVEYRDTDGDGLFDRWLIDEKADGAPDRTLDVPQTHRSGKGDPRTWPGRLSLNDWRGVVATYRPLLEGSVRGHETVLRALDGDPAATDTDRGPEGRRWDLEHEVASAFGKALATARSAGDEARAQRLTRARGLWDAGRCGQAAEAVRQGM